MARRLGWLVLGLTGALTLGCGWLTSSPGDAAPPSTARRPAPAGAGRVLDWRDDINGEARQAKVSLPPGYDGTTPVPVVLALHGGGGDIRTMMEQNGWKATLDAQGWIGIYPQTGRRGRDGNESSESGDVVYYEALLDRAFAELAVDRKRVYVVGFSAGGRGTYLLANRRYADLTAIAAASATVRRSADPPELTDPVKNGVTGLSLIHIHGKKDTRVPWDGGQVRREEGYTDERPPAEGLERWSKALGATKSSGSKPVPGRERLKGQRWTAPDGHVVQVIVDPQLGHTWAPWANEMIVEFFEAAPTK